MWQAVLVKGYLRSSDGAAGGSDHRCDAVFPCPLYTHLRFCPILTSTTRFNTHVHKGAAEQKKKKNLKNVSLIRWWHIRDIYCNITPSYGELSWHSASACAPRAYRLHLMNWVDWIGRQAWGEKRGRGSTGEGEPARCGGPAEAPRSLILPCLFLRLSAMILFFFLPT